MGKVYYDLFGDTHQTKTEAPKAANDTTSSDAPPDYHQSSKEKFARLKPYFDKVLVQLATSHKYDPPDAIKNRGDVFSSQLILTVGKFRPLLSKKLGIPWSTIEKDLIRPLIKKHRAEHYPESLRTLDNIPWNEWFYGDEPLSSAMDILLAARRMKCEIMYDEWFDVCRVNYKGETLQSMKLDDIYYLLTKDFTYHFKFRIEKRHTMDALGVLRRDPQYVFNSRIDWLDSFVPHYDPNFNWQRECVEIPACKIDDYHKEVARALFISPVERSYRPGCILQHMIILDDPLGDKGKSTFCRILAGNPTLEYGHTKYFTDKNVFAIKNDVTRYTETKGKAVHEYAELARLSQMNLEHLKNDISSTVESFRPLWSQDSYERPRWFYSIGTTNKDQYNYDTINRRYYGMKAAIDGKMVDNQRFITNYNKIMGALVWNVKNGMSGAISKDIANDARYHQDIRVVETDLMMILKKVFAFAHVVDDILPRTVRRDKLLEYYQIGYKDLRDGDTKLLNRTYMISLTGLSNFATDYTDFRKRKDIKIDLQSIKEAIVRLMVEVDIPVDPDHNDIPDLDDYKGDKDKITYRSIYFKWKSPEKPIRVPSLRNPIRPYSLTIDAPSIRKIETLGMGYIVELQDFIEEKLNAKRLFHLQEDEKASKSGD